MHSLRTALSICVAICLAPPSQANGQDRRPDRVAIEYVPPKDPKHRPIYELVKERKALEQVQAVFKPFMFPTDVLVRTVGCDGVINAWYQRPNITICYEYLADIRNNLPSGNTPSGTTPEDGVIGQFFYVAAHEMGHAVFDLLNVPLFGRPEDAADQFSAYMMLQVGRDQARRLIMGAAYAYQRYLKNPKIVVRKTAFASVHGAPLQRFYNLMCVGYGADRRTFADLIRIGYLPQERARRCAVEFGELNFAFQQLVTPQLDPRLMDDVVGRNWFAKPPRSASSDVP